jgi:hypothetical protein
MKIEKKDERRKEKQRGRRRRKRKKKNDFKSPVIYIFRSFNPNIANHTFYNARLNII